MPIVKNANAPLIAQALQSHQNCMVCGASSALGLQFEPCAAGVKAQFVAPIVWQGYSGILHGGMICTLLDAAMTHCLFQQGIQALTADLAVRFMQPVPCLQTLQLRAGVKSQRRDLYQLWAELSCAGKTLARSEAKFIRCKPSNTESSRHLANSNVPDPTEFIVTAQRATS